MVVIIDFCLQKGGGGYLKGNTYTVMSVIPGVAGTSIFKCQD